MGVRVVVELGKLRGLCGEWGCANLRGLIMTPCHSLQELPSFAHHITCMAWHGSRGCMSFLTQLGTCWLQGKLLHGCGCAVPACFQPEERNKTEICFFTFVLSSKVERNNTVFPSSDKKNNTEYSEQLVCNETCLFPPWRHWMNDVWWLTEHLWFYKKRKIVIVLCKKQATENQGKTFLSETPKRRLGASIFNWQAFVSSTLSVIWRGL